MKLDQEMRVLCNFLIPIKISTEKHSLEPKILNSDGWFATLTYAIGITP